MNSERPALVPAKDGESELIEKKSRFLGHLFRVETEEEALAHLKEMRDRYWDANHNVYAYVLQGGTMRYSDDGEPGGTAGMPVLEILRHEELTQVLCVVTRYFGGTLLGTGGLVRAYGKTAKLAVEDAGIAKRCLWTSMELPCPYPLFEQVRKCLLANGALISDTQYGSDVLLNFMIPAENEAELAAALTDLTAGRLSVLPTGSEFRDFPLK